MGGEGKKKLKNIPGKKKKKNKKSAHQRDRETVSDQAEKTHT